MPGDADGTETVQVKTRVPAHQRAAWREAAESLDMSQSEFVRTMVQAGRRGFEPADTPTSNSSPEEPAPEGSNPRGEALEDRLREALHEEAAVGWDELVDSLLGDFEERLEAALQSADGVRYSGPKGGYVLDDGE